MRTVRGLYHLENKKANHDKAGQERSQVSEPVQAQESRVVQQMKIQRLVGIYFIFIAVGMFGGGGIVVFEILDPQSPVKILFIVTTIIGIIPQLFYFKQLSSAEKELKRLEN